MAELKRELKARGLSAVGNKQELSERLRHALSSGLYINLCAFIQSNFLNMYWEVFINYVPNDEKNFCSGFKCEPQRVELCCSHARNCDTNTIVPAGSTVLCATHWAVGLAAPRVHLRNPECSSLHETSTTHSTSIPNQTFIMRKNVKQVSH